MKNFIILQCELFLQNKNTVKEDTLKLLAKKFLASNEYNKYFKENDLNAKL